MPDKVELYVGDVKIEHFLSYSIPSDLYTPADAFNLELANPETEIVKGSLCQIKINDKLELTGIIDKVRRKISKSGVSLSVEGRDYMGLLLDSYCEPPFKTVTGMKLKALAELLLAKVPFITRKTVVYQENVVGKLKGKKTSAASGFVYSTDAAQKIGQIEAGMTIFDVLKNYSLSRGMLFYCLPDGTLVFGRPLAKGAPQFTLTMLETGKGNNVLESEVEEDISKRYSKYTVIGQQQGDEETSADAINTPPGIKTDADFPFYKPFITVDNNDNVSPGMRARMLMEKHRREGTQLVYTVGRHSQNSQNWAINAMCHIKDEKQSMNGTKGIDADFLIYGRTFTLSKVDGPRTIVKLGLPGVVA